MAQKIAKATNLSVELIQCKMAEVPGYSDRANLLITTTGVGKAKAEKEILGYLTR